MATGVVGKIEQAHQMYREGKHEDALELYTEALAMAKSKAQKIALHSNRAACYLKMQDFKTAADECTSVLELDHQHTGALMLRAQTLVTLKDYQSALFDVNRLMELNPSSEVYRNLEARLRTQLALAPIPESEEEALSLEEEHAVTVERMDAKLTGHGTCSAAPVTKTQDSEIKPNANAKSNGWESIPKPKGHSGLDYSRWDRVEFDSSEEDDEDEEQQPQYKFRVRTVGVRPVK